MIADRWGTSWLARGPLPDGLAVVEREEMDRRCPLPRVALFDREQGGTCWDRSCDEACLWCGFSGGWSWRPRGLA